MGYLGNMGHGEHGKIIYNLEISSIGSMTKTQPETMDFPHEILLGYHGKILYQWA